MPEGNPPEPAPVPAPAVHHVGPIEFEDVLAAMRRLGHRVFDRENFNLNVVGIRRTATRLNAFNDVLISDSFVAQVRQSQRIFGNRFTYTLLGESEL